MPSSPAPKHNPRVLILASRPADFQSAAGYLDRRDYVVEMSRSLNEAIESIAAGTCDYLLLSIDFPNGRAEILPQVLEQTFNVAVIVFAEKQDRRTTQRLGSLKARNILFSQPSGPSILARIKQVWVPPPSEREAKRKQQFDAKSANAGEKFLTPKEVAAQLLELLNRTLVPDVDSAPALPPIATPPKAFEFSTEAPPVITRVRRRRPVSKAEVDDYGQPIGRPTSFETKVHEVVWDTVDNSLQDVCPSKSKLSHFMGPVTEAELMCIDAMNFKGTFVIAYCGDEGSSDASPIVAAEAKLIADLKVRGYIIRDEDVKVLPMFDFDIPTKLLNAAELVVTHSCRQFDVSFAYYSSTRLIPLFEKTSDEMMTIDIGQFVPGSTVNVDIFLPMPLNKKFVRYWRRGSEVTEEQLTKVASHGAVQLGVRNDQADLFSQYCAYQAIKAEISKIDIKRAIRKKVAA